MLKFKQATATIWKPVFLWAIAAFAVASYGQFRVNQPELLAADPPAESSLRYDLLVAIVEGNWPQAATLARKVPPEQPQANSSISTDDSVRALQRLAQWTLATAADQTPGVNSVDLPLPLGWRHPLAMPSNKDAFLRRNELETALKSNSLDEACELVASLTSSAFVGLFPDESDRQRFLTLPTAIVAALHERPLWRAEISRRLSAAAQTQLHLARSRNDPAGIRLVALQFPGTPAGSDAFCWLADRHLAAGAFVDSECDYRFALDFATAEQKQQIERRLQIATGYTHSHRLTRTSLTASPIAGDTESPEQPVASATQSSLAPGKYQLREMLTLADEAGNHTARKQFRSTAAVGNQLGIAADDQQFYLNHRFQVSAYDRRSGRLNWTHHLEAEPGNVDDDPIQTMRPVLAKEVLYARRLTREGTELCCFQQSDGALLWKQRSRADVLTDPLILGDEILALTSVPGEDDLLQIELARWHRHTGELLSTTSPLLQMRDLWNEPIPSELAASDRWLAAHIGCVAVGLTPSGELRWLRRPTWLPPPVDDLRFDFRSSHPLIQGERLHLAVRGARCVECVELSSGKLLWRRPVPDLRGVFGLSGNYLIVHAGQRLLSLDSESGDILWQQPIAGQREACVIDHETIVCVRRDSSSPPASLANLIWLDAATGRELARIPLQMADREAWELGPMFPLQQTCFVIGSQPGTHPRLKLFEILGAEKQ